LVRGVAKAPEIALADINVMFDTNVTGLINMTQAILPVFKKRPDGGRGDIINIGSIAGRSPYPGGSIYCATKAAMRSFTEALRMELIDTRIRVIEIDPGQVETVRSCPYIAVLYVVKRGLTVKQEFSVVRFYGDKAKADAVYAYAAPATMCHFFSFILGVTNCWDLVAVSLSRRRTLRRLSSSPLAGGKMWSLRTH
jgi:3-hydroxy acid dehydrogenase/malonic semialdehyde reductase